MGRWRRSIILLPLLVLMTVVSILYANDVRETSAAPGKDFQVTITSVSPATTELVAQGSLIRYTVVLRNAGDTAISTTDATPALRLQSDNGDIESVTGPMTCTAPPVTTIDCQLNNQLGAGQSITLDVTVRVTAPSGNVLLGALADPGDQLTEDNDDADHPTLSCSTVGEGTDAGTPDEPDNFDCLIHTIGSIDLMATKTAVPAESEQVAPGSTVLYTVTVRKNGAAALGVPVRDMVSGPVAIVDVVAGPNVSCTHTPSQANCTVDFPEEDDPNLSVDDLTATFDIVVRVNTNAAIGATLRQGVYVDPNNDITETNDDADDPDLDCSTVGEGTDAGPNDEPDNFDCTEHTVGSIDLVVTKTANPAEGSVVTSGSTITYQVTVNKVGAAARVVKVQDSLTFGLSITDVTEGTGVDCSVAGNTIECDLEFLTNGPISRTFTVQATVTVASGSVLEGVTVDPLDEITELNEDADDPDFNCSNVGEGQDTGVATEPDNFDCALHQVGGSDLVITKSGPISVASGATITYTITVQNVGTAAANNYYVDDFISSGITVTSFTTTEGDCDQIAPSFAGDPPWPGAATIRCGPFNTPPGGTETITITAQVTAPVGSNILNGALVDPTNVVDEANEGADDADLACGGVGEGLDNTNTEPDNYDCTSTSVGTVKGDINCDGQVDAVDALLILRYIVGLPVNLPPGCGAIGS